MAINFREGTIDDVPEIVLKPIRFIRAMEELNEGYINREKAFWFELLEVEGNGMDEEAAIGSSVDAGEMCYSEGQISDKAFPED